ncbi:DNA recombination protein RmuC, partial [Pseudomonas sp. BGM005]|nr:DNA recombination protein RmuC [Pseudomonas sp. BG5]
MDALTIALLLAALVVGAAAGWFLRAGRGAADQARAQAELAAARDDRDRQYDLY